MVDSNHNLVPQAPLNVSQENRINWLTENLDKFCVLPWLNLNTNTNGMIKLCCAITIDHHVADDRAPYNLGYDDIELIWDSIYMNAARRKHRENTGCYECAGCYDSEKVSGHSPRLGQNALWIQRKENDKELNRYFTKVSDYKPYTSVEQLPISLELRLGNQCNLKCISCWGMSSSLIHEERMQILQSGELVRNNLDWLHKRWREEAEIVDNADVKEWYETETFYNNFKKMAPKLRRLYTTGGEPTLIKANYRMLEELIAAGNTKCRVEFTSNMTTWNPKFYDALNQFDEVEVQMSIDGIGSTAEYIRYGSDWSKVRENVERVLAIAATKPNWTVRCYTVLQALNYQHVPEIWDFLAEVSNKNNSPVHWWPIILSHPAHLSLGAESIEQRMLTIPEIKQRANKYADPVANPYFCIIQDTLNALIDSIANTAFDNVLHERFTAYKNFLDKHRLKNG